jgi:hypothetical protein
MPAYRLPFRSKPDNEIEADRSLANCSITPSPHPITKSCRNAVAFAALSRRETTEDNLMPFLFWMPMIVMCGLWRAAQEDAESLIPTQR